ncbi:MAG: ankyrin repeat domain-containing protein [Bryobacterales bacterium]|nr:ankyrin repeat domain-containing protein [Bryobacterales bacterium]
MRRLQMLLLAPYALFGFDAAQDFLQAARQGNLDGVKTAIGAKVDVESKTRYGQTPLYLAAMNGHAGVVKLLLENGAQVDVTDTFYKSSLIGFAASRKHVDVVKLLLAKSTAHDANLGTVVGLRNAELVAAALAAGKPSQKALDAALESAETDAAIAGLLKGAGANPPAPGLTVDAKILDSYAGSYRAEGLPFAVRLGHKEGKLTVQADGQPEFVPKAKSDKLFEFAPARIAIEFGDAPGAFTLRQGGGTYAFKKVVTPQ